MQFHFILSIFIGVATGDKWPNLRTTFGFNIFGNAFESQPRTQADAVSHGYSPISSDNSCAGKHLGFAYADPAEPSLVLLYDEAGYIAGVQSVVLKSAVNLTYFDVPNKPAYVEGTFFGQEAWFTTAYFVDPAVICSGGRSEEQWSRQGTGDRLWIQVGEAPDNFVKIPLTQLEADGNMQKNWHKHLCFWGMGTHYMEFNYEIDQDCNSVFPVQILYDKGVITGFVWHHLANLPGARWEHANTRAIKMSIDRPPQCALDFAETPGIVSLHHYFYNHPWFTHCF